VRIDPIDFRDHAFHGERLGPIELGGERVMSGER